MNSNLKQLLQNAKYIIQRHRRDEAEKLYNELSQKNSVKMVKACGVYLVIMY